MVGCPLSPGLRSNADLASTIVMYTIHYRIYQLDLCPSLFTVGMIKLHGHQELMEERVYFRLNFQVTIHLQGSQNRSSRQDTGGRN